LRSDGQRIGFDPSRPISGNGVGSVLNEFPLADVDQQNIATDNSDGTRTLGSASTWNVAIMDESPASYTVRLTGLAEKAGSLYVAFVVHGSSARIFAKAKFLIGPTGIREFVVSSSRADLSVKMARIIAPQDLEQSIRIACDLKLIKEEGICRSLSAKAREAGVSVERGQLKAARGQINAFESELSAQAGQHIKEPALTILREEAEALLNPPPPLVKSKPQAKAKAKK